MADDLTLRVAKGSALAPAALYRLLQLRSRVFVVEQNSVYLDLDGQDLEPGTRHVWLARADQPSEPVAALRLLEEPDGAVRIGRVVVAPDARGAGLATRLMTEALRLVGSRRSVLDAQSNLVGYYGRFGYVVAGDEYVDGGIPHTPMARPATAAR